MAPVLGAEVVRDGTDLMLASVQHPRINKRFLILVLEIVCTAVFPEMAVSSSNNSSSGASSDHHSTVAVPPHLVRQPPALPPRKGTAMPPISAAPTPAPDDPTAARTANTMPGLKAPQPQRPSVPSTPVPASSTSMLRLLTRPDTARHSALPHI